MMKYQNLKTLFVIFILALIVFQSVSCGDKSEPSDIVSDTTSPNASTQKALQRHPKKPLRIMILKSNPMTAEDIPSIFSITATTLSQILISLPKS